jgi:hypothetical protein
MSPLSGQWGRGPQTAPPAVRHQAQSPALLEGVECLEGHHGPQLVQHTQLTGQQGMHPAHSTALHSIVQHSTVHHLSSRAVRAARLCEACKGVSQLHHVVAPLLHASSEGVEVDKIGN